MLTTRTLPTLRLLSLGWLSTNPARSLVFAIAAAYALVALLIIPFHWHMEDAGSYWNAALRLQAGAPLYFSSPNPSDSALYWYAPWFALAWVPLTWLPHAVVIAGWGVLLSLAAAWLIWPNWRSSASVALSLLLLPDLLRVTSTGNVQPLLLAVVAWGITSRWGPLLIALAASLKGWPLLFAAYWWRQPSRIAIAAGVAALLILPALAFDLSAYPQREGGLLTPGTLSALLVVSRVSRGRPSTG